MPSASAPLPTWSTPLKIVDVFSMSRLLTWSFSADLISLISADLTLLYYYRTKRVVLHAIICQIYTIKLLLQHPLKNLLINYFTGRNFCGKKFFLNLLDSRPIRGIRFHKKVFYTATLKTSPVTYSTIINIFYLRTCFFSRT